jgi:hypothetical protein
MKNNKVIKPGYELRNDFQININWVGQNRRFAVKFNRGIYQDQIFYYDHDVIYEIARDHLESLKSFKNYGYNLSTSNVPGYAEDYLIQNP